MPFSGYKKIQEEVEGSDSITSDNNEYIDTIQSTLPVNIKATEDENVFTMAIAKVGSKAYNKNGEKYTFTREAFEAYAKTWEGGIITLNHGKQDDGEILAAWFDPETDLVMANVKVDNNETATRIRKNEPTGVSIEANVISTDDENNITAFAGTGLGIIFYPEQPACPLKDGCGILAKEQYNEKMVEASEKRREKITAYDYDLAKRNEDGSLIKIDSVMLWDDMGEPENEIYNDIIYYVSYFGEGEYELLESSDTQIGETLAGEPVYTVNIDINKSTTGGTLMATENEPEMVAKADYDAVEAKLKELENTYTTEVEAKDKKIEDLEAEINRRDTEIAASLVEEIKAMDAEFEPEEGMPLNTIQTIHASLKRAVESKKEDVEASEQDEEIEASEFTAPEAERSNGGFTIGGIVNGKWTK